jgi:putative acyl-CoA dehydrogenase
MTGPDPFEVNNQPPPRGDLDLFGADPVVRDHARAAGADSQALSRFGTAAGRAATRDLGAEARRVPPVLDAWDPAGRRCDVVRFHPAYHDLMALGARRHGLHAQPGRTGRLLPDDDDLCRRARAVGRPRRHALAAAVTARAYDPARRPVADKVAATMGMAMTEKQGGSDVRANHPRRAGRRGLPADGHKWFCSAPMSDGFLTLAQAPGAHLLRRAALADDGTRNAIHLLRLKDKLGNRANASAEIEYDGAWRTMLGEEGAASAPSSRWSTTRGSTPRWRPRG